jgi:hypothetical protein
MEYEIDRACSTNVEEEKERKLVVEKLEGNRPLGRRRRRSVDNIKKNLGE